jgi:hypothetical protein
MSFALFGRAWTSTEVTEGRAPGASDPLPCSSGRVAVVACYRFDDVAGEFIVDLSGSANDLWKPVRLVFDKRPLGLPGVPSFSGSDVPVNLLGFVPFGFLVCLRLLTAGKPSPRGCLFLAVALGFAVSLAIELTQVWLPGRDSSLLDLTMNTVGSAIGGAMAFYLGRAYGKLLK